MTKIVSPFGVHPWRLTWNLRIHPLEKENHHLPVCIKTSGFCGFTSFFFVAYHFQRYPTQNQHFSHPKFSTTLTLQRLVLHSWWRPMVTSCRRVQLRDPGRSRCISPDGFTPKKQSNTGNFFRFIKVKSMEILSSCLCLSSTLPRLVCKYSC